MRDPEEDGYRMVGVWARSLMSGATMADWPALVAAARAAEADGALTVTGLWTHFACAGEPNHPSVRRQRVRGAEQSYVRGQHGHG